jgi:TRAP-type C4-dicarboxylate transport system substrate-binding protein
MLEMPISPVMGGIVMNRVTWNKLSQAHQQEILRVTQRIAAEFDAATPQTETNAISAMGRDGLSVNRPTQVQENLWRTELEAALPSLVGSVIDRDIYQRINAILERARSR